MREENPPNDNNNKESNYNMALYLQSDRDSTGAKVWQPWFGSLKESSHPRGEEESPLSGGGGKELPTRHLKEQRMRQRLVRHSPLTKQQQQRREVEEESEDEINVVDTSPPSIPQLRMGVPSPSHSPRLYHPPSEHSPRLLYPGPPLSPHLYQLPPAHSPVHPTYTALPPSHSPHMFHPLAAYSNTPSDTPQSMNEEEGPIDMSIKKPPTSLSNPPQANHSSNPPPYIPPRPSVITVASPDSCSPATAPPRVSPHPPRVSPPPPPYNVATAQLLRHRGLLQPLNSNHHPTDRRNPHSKLSSRPESEVDTKFDIEEHFRRSLGTTYSHIFDERNPPGGEEPSPPEETKGSSPPHSDENDDVDDHFSKALGKFWVDFKAKKSGTPPPPPAYSSSLPPPPSYKSTSTSLSILGVTRSDTSSTYQPATITRVTSSAPDTVFTYQHKLYNRVTSGRGQSPSPSAVSSSAPSSPSSRASPSTFTPSKLPSNSFSPNS